jgi:hypothetical protein
VIGVALYGLAVPVVWLLGPALGLSFFVIMIIFHAVTSEGLQEGPLGRLFRVRLVDATRPRPEKLLAAADKTVNPQIS